MISLAIKNIKNSFKAYRNIYGLLIVSQIVAILILLFVYGIVANSSIKIKEKETRFKFMSANFAEPVSVDKIKEFLPEIFAEFKSEMTAAYVTMGMVEIVNKSDNVDKVKVSLISTMDFEKGKYIMPQEGFAIDRIRKGRYMSAIEMTDGSDVALAFGENNSELFKCTTGDKVELYGKEYEIIGILDDVNGVYQIAIPLNSCTEDMKAESIYIEFEEFPTVSDYYWFHYKIDNDIGGDASYSDLELVEFDDIISYKTVIIIAVVVGGIAAFDTILIYSYLIKKRKKQMAIFSIEGATRTQQLMICAIETILITGITTTVGVVLFESVIKNILLETYEVNMTIYTVKIYSYLLLSYFLMITIGTSIMLAFSIRKKALDIRRA